MTGSSPAFIAVCLATLLWLASGPLLSRSDAWQLIINTLSNIVAMLMLFLIQNTQNRESAALQLKIERIVARVAPGAERFRGSGLRAGSRIGFIPPAANVARNTERELRKTR